MRQRGFGSGPQGATGSTGAAGPGVPNGGTTGQVLAKDSATDQDTSWQDVIADIAFDAAKNGFIGGGGTALTTGKDNIAIGAASDDNSTTEVALAALTSGTANVAIGSSAMGKTTTGSGNTALGESALYANTTGGQNIAVGSYALFGNTTGSGNVGLGANALDEVTTGIGNLGLGDGAGSTTGDNATGSYNIAIGESASNFGNINNSVAIGRGAQADTSGTLALGADGSDAGHPALVCRRYNGDALVGNGLASVVASIALTTQAANITTTTLFTAPAAGVYRVSVYQLCSTAGSAGTLAVTIGWTDNVQAQSTKPAADTDLATLGNVSRGVTILQVANAAVISYAAAITGGTGSPKFDLFVIVERLS